MKKPPKIKQKLAVGGDVESLNADQKNEYDALLTPEAKAAYLKTALSFLKGAGANGAANIGVSGGAKMIASGGAKIIGDTATAASTGISATPFSIAGEAGSALINKIGTKTGDDTSVMATSMGSKALERMGQGAALGSVIPGVGTVLAAGIGGAEGLIEGAIEGQGLVQANKKKRDDELQALVPEKSGKGVYAEGGTIKGQGGPKSDSIDMDLEENSFVVPAEYAHIAKQLRKKYLS